MKARIVLSLLVGVAAYFIIYRSPTKSPTAADIDAIYDYIIGRYPMMPTL